VCVEKVNVKSKQANKQAISQFGVNVAVLLNKNRHKANQPSNQPNQAINQNQNRRAQSSSSSHDVVANQQKQVIAHSPPCTKAAKSTSKVCGPTGVC
jgi:hypothetical protein